MRKRKQRLTQSFLAVDLTSVALSWMAAYYARVLENPSCRWTGWQCMRMPAGGRPEACSSPDVPLTLRERAWSSPIWSR